MAFAIARLKEIALLTDTAAAVYTLPAATTAYIKSIHLHNTNTTVEAVRIWNVPNGVGAIGTAADGNKWFHIELSPNESVEIPFANPVVLSDAYDSIQACSTTASKVTIQIYGATE